MSSSGGEALEDENVIKQMKNW